MDNHDKDVLTGILFPALFVCVLWALLIFDSYFEMGFVRYGLFPRRLSGLPGILLSPLIHGNYSHLLSNTIPLLILGWIMFYMYKSIAFSIFFWIYIMTGLWVWLGGRQAYHIGASGLVYGFVCFLFFSGIFRSDKRLLALSLLVTFIYGGLIWGVFPISRATSWESHFLGSVAGIITAFHFRNEGPQRIKYDWEEEPDDEDPIMEEVDENKKAPNI